MTTSTNGKRFARSTPISGRHGRRPWHLQRATGLNRSRCSALAVLAERSYGAPLFDRVCARCALSQPGGGAMLTKLGITKLFDGCKVGKPEDELRLSQRSFQREAALKNAVRRIAKELTSECHFSSFFEGNSLFEHSGFRID
jgi:hypothetical protein